jgi:hypothetical protein
MRRASASWKRIDGFRGIEHHIDALQVHEPRQQTKQLPRTWQRRRDRGQATDPDIVFEFRRDAKNLEGHHDPTAGESGQPPNCCRIRRGTHSYIDMSGVFLR